MSPVKTKTQTIAQPTELTAAHVATLLQHSQDGLAPPSYSLGR